MLIVKKIALSILLVIPLFLASCTPAIPAPSVPTIAWKPPAASATPAATTTIAPTAITAPSATAAPAYPPEGYPPEGYPPEGFGPTNFPAGIDPLIGLPAAEALLARRPVIIKIENLPRNHRPQSGLSSADLVYEYYTEEGTTRFAAVFLGHDAEQVTPIRSARWFDIRLVQMYKANLIFGGAYERLRNELFKSSFASRLIIEAPGSCPALCRVEPNGKNLLSANTAALGDYLKARNMDNAPQNLDGMLFQAQAPTGGMPAAQVFTRFSGAIYNRWDYDPAAGTYLRFSETQDDLSRTNEVYAQLTDALTGQPIDAANLVVILAPYLKVETTAEVMDVNLTGSGKAYLFRDGQAYPLKWSHPDAQSLLTFTREDGTSFPFKPGNTWFEVMGSSSSVAQLPAWKFIHVFP